MMKALRSQMDLPVAYRRLPLIALALAMAAVPGTGTTLAKEAGAKEAGAKEAGSPPVTSEWEDNVVVLAGQMRGEVQRLPADSSVETFEAALLFLIDQSNEPQNVICAAVNVVKAEPTTPPPAQTALANICRQATARRGTGAIPNTRTGFGPSGFSAPAISTGGGSSGYTP